MRVGKNMAGSTVSEFLSTWQEIPAFFSECAGPFKGTDFTFLFSVKRTPAYAPLSIPVSILFQVIELFCLFAV